MAEGHEYEYDDVDFISRHLKCPLCSEPFVRPVSVRCKNKQEIFCRDCIEEWIKHNHSCPKCHRNLNIQNLNPAPNGILTDMLDDLPVKCLSCGQTRLKRGSFFDHKNTMCTSADISDISSAIASERIRILEQHENDLQNENQQLRDRINQQESEITAIQDENQHLRIQLNQQHTQTETVQSKNQQLIIQLNQQQSRIDALENENQQLAARINEQNTDIEKLQHDNRQLKLRVDEQKNQIETFQNENQQLHTQLNEHKTIIETLENKIEQQKNESEQQKNEIEQLKIQINRHGIVLDELLNKIGQLTDAANGRQIQYTLPNMDINKASTTRHLSQVSRREFSEDNKQDNDGQNQRQALYNESADIITAAAKLLVEKLINIGFTMDNEKEVDDNPDRRIQRQFVNAIVDNVISSLVQNSTEHKQPINNQNLQQIVTGAAAIAKMPSVEASWANIYFGNPQVQIRGNINNNKQLNNNQNQQQYSSGVPNNLRPPLKGQLNRRNNHSANSAHRPASADWSSSSSDNSNARINTRNNNGLRYKSIINARNYEAHSSTNDSAGSPAENLPEPDINRQIGNTYNS